jgi:hypothetical protein
VFGNENLSEHFGTDETAFEPIVRFGVDPAEIQSCEDLFLFHVDPI